MEQRPRPNIVGRIEWMSDKEFAWIVLIIILLILGAMAVLFGTDAWRYAWM